jgi:hypothetical protein
MLGSGLASAVALQTKEAGARNGRRYPRRRAISSVLPPRLYSLILPGSLPDARAAAEVACCGQASTEAIQADGKQRLVAGTRKLTPVLGDGRRVPSFDATNVSQSSCLFGTASISAKKQRTMR